MELRLTGIGLSAVIKRRAVKNLRLAHTFYLVWGDRENCTWLRLLSGALQAWVTLLPVYSVGGV